MIERISPSGEAAVLALNNEHAEELSWLEPDRLSHLIGEAFYARKVGDLDAFILAFDECADYDSANYLWFRARYPRFVYVDRIAVAAHARGRGLARRIYLDLFDTARQAGHELVTCEVNLDPPNPASDAFHAALGFVEAGQGILGSGKKTVRYFVRVLGG